MNSSVKLLVAALFFSALPVAAHVQDYDLCRADNRAVEKVAATLDDVEAALLYLLVDQVPDKYSCSFDIKCRVKKAIIKYFLNRFILNNSLDLVAEVPSAGLVPVLTTDQAMEIGLTVFNDLSNKKAGTTVLANAGKTFVREKVVAALVWLLAQTNVEQLLPDTLTSTTAYSEARNEIGRHFVDQAIAKVLR